MLIQEPYTTAFNAIHTLANFRPIFPINRLQNKEQICSVIWVNKKLNTKNWKALNIPGTNNITAIQLKGQYGKISIFNIYNDCNHPRNERTLWQYIHNNFNQLTGQASDSMIWAGDFNRHHPLWDRDKDTHLFTQQATRAAEELIELLATYNMSMTLPKGISTLQHMVTKRYSRPDNLFCTGSLLDQIIKCKVDPILQPTLTDHFLITTKLLITQERTIETPSYNFREVDWELFRRTVRKKLNKLPKLTIINNNKQLNRDIHQLTSTLQDTIKETVRITKPRLDAKRWWNSKLTKMKKMLNKLKSKVAKMRAIEDHPIHWELRNKSRLYGEAIIQTKREHWANYLEEMTALDLWTANRFIKEPAGDGGSPKIPTLKSKDEEGNKTQVINNEDKAQLFAKMFFYPPPVPIANLDEFEYFNPLPDPPQHR